VHSDCEGLRLIVGLDRLVQDCARSAGSSTAASFINQTNGEPMRKQPNYKQEKKRREEAQKKRNAEEQERQAARKHRVPQPAGKE
jgi:hypothetical protein